MAVFWSVLAVIACAYLAWYLCYLCYEAGKMRGKRIVEDRIERRYNKALSEYQSFLEREVPQDIDEIRKWTDENKRLSEVYYANYFCLMDCYG